MYALTIKLFITLMFFSAFAFGQQVYQSGKYPRQSIRPHTEVIKGTLIDKFTSNGYFWYSVVDHDKIYKISVMKSVFDSANIQSKVVLANCFKLSSRKWKCEPAKKKSTFMQRNVFYADAQEKK